MPAVSRRAHHKSRAGCTTCKSKKVKCDEATPCSYCVKRNLPCSLEPEPEPSRSQSQSQSQSQGSTGRDSNTPDPITQPDDDLSFAFDDFSLFRHFTQNTALAQGDDEASVEVFRGPVADLATKHPYLLHEVSAVAALHLRAVSPPEQAEALTRAAEEHQAKAIPLFREALASMTAETALPLFACSCLFIPYHAAAAKDASELLFNKETGDVAEWMTLVHGCAAIMIQHAVTIFQSPLLPLLGNLYTPKVEDLPAGPNDARLVELSSKLPVVHEHKECKEAYECTMVKLRVCFYISDRADKSMDRKNAAFRFPPLMDPHFREDLAARLPPALIIMAHWCVLLNRVDDRWWLRNRVKPLLLFLAGLVPPEHKWLLEWPLKECGLHPMGEHVIR
ncbi:hypothetical protein F5Y05DRAFT_169924 [Hypoxylon sp. FL0543]|nr:hypothetical protein F5Y05DRAFT_169924 [Hypoxylon sp. FL0543]